MHYLTFDEVIIIFFDYFVYRIFSCSVDNGSHRFINIIAMMIVTIISIIMITMISENDKNNDNAYGNTD